MKHFTQKFKFFVTLVLFAFGCTMGGAKTVTFDFTVSDYGLPNNSNDYVTNPTTIQQDGVEITLNGESARSWRMWSDGLRAYSGNTPSFTVSAQGQTITEVSWTGNATFGLDKDTTIPKWTGNATEVKFVATSSGNNAVKTISITYGSDDNDENDDLEGTIDDVLTKESMGLSGNASSYGTYSDISIRSDARYYANTAFTSDGAIQLRSTSNSGIVTTTSGGKVKSITIKWRADNTAGRSIDVYGSHTAYSTTENLYNTIQGTKLGSSTYNANATEYTIKVYSDYEYVGLRSTNGAIYIDKITIVWDAEDKKQEPGLAYEVTTITKNIGDDEFVNPLTNPYNLDVTYESDNEDVAIVIDGEVLVGEVGTATITASFAGNDKYAAGSASYTVKVIDPDAISYYKKVTATNELTNGDYLIVYENEDGNLLAMNGGLTELDVANNYVEMTLNNGLIECNESVDAAYFTYNAANKTLKSVSGYYIGQTKDDNGLATNKTSSYENTIEIDEDGNANIVSSGAYLRYNSTSNQNRFRYYKSASYGSQKAIQLYKKVLKEDVINDDSETGALEATEDGETVYYMTYVTTFDVDMSKSKNVDAYIVTGVEKNGSTLAVQKVNAVPAGTALLLKATENEKYTIYEAPYVAEENVDLTANLLKAGNGEKVGTNVTDAYGLGEVDGKTGFYRIKEGVTIPTNKAYLLLSTLGISETKAFYGLYDDGEATGIKLTERESADAVYYNLQGQRVVAPTHGIYIVNGKKVFIK